MPSFSSVVRKSGGGIKPKVPPRRNLPRRAIAASPPISQEQSNQTINDGSVEQSENVLNETSELHENERSSVPPAREEPDAPDVDSTRKASVLRSPRLRKSRAFAEQETAAKSIDAASEITAEHGARQAAQSPSNDVYLSNITLSTADSAAKVNSRTARATRGVYTTAENRQKRRKTTSDTMTPSATILERDGTTSGEVRLPTSATDAPAIQGQPADDLLRSATERAASVSSLANEIDSHLRSQGSRHTSSGNMDMLDTPAQDTASIAARKRLKTRGRKKIANQVAEIVADATQSAGREYRQRDKTPEDAANYELEPDEITMGELVKDRRLGKKSQLEEDMQRDWADIIQRRREARDLALENAQKGRRKAFGHLADIPLQATVAIGPKTEIRNGKIVVIEESRQIDRSGALEQAAVLDAENVREDKFYYKRVNQSTVGIKSSAGRRSRWDEASTEQFFRGLQMFGTDFLMIANLFPGIDRKQVKMKFIREENADKSKVMHALANRIPIDLEEYSKITETTLQNPEDVQAEIDAEEQRLKDEDQQRRIREGFVNANAQDNPIPSTEMNGTDPAETAPDGTPGYAALAEEIMAPRNKRQRKAGSSVRKRGVKASRRPAEGYEEMLGSIDEVRV